MGAVWAEVLLVPTSAPAPAQSIFPSAFRREIDLLTEMNLYLFTANELYFRTERMLVYNENARASSAL